MDVAGALGEDTGNTQDREDHKEGEERSADHEEIPKNSALPSEHQSYHILSTRLQLIGRMMTQGLITLNGKVD